MHNGDPKYSDPARPPAAWTTVIVSVWVAELPMPFDAVTTTGNVPSVVGVPESVAVPFAPGVNVMPGGSAPDSVRVGVGVPCAVTVKRDATPSGSATEDELVIEVPDASPTVMWRLWVAGEPTPLAATIATV